MARSKPMPPAAPVPPSVNAPDEPVPPDPVLESIRPPPDVSLPIDVMAASAEFAARTSLPHVVLAAEATRLLRVHHADIPDVTDAMVALHPDAEGVRVVVSASEDPGREKRAWIVDFALGTLAILEAAHAREKEKEHDG